MMFSANVKAALAGVGLAVILGLSGCSGSSAARNAGATATSTTTAAGPTSSGPVIARDGSSLLPAAEVGACSLLGVDQIREVLGDAAQDIQQGEVAGTVSPGGVRIENCIYSLDASGTTTHAVVLEAVTYPDEASRAGVDPWETMSSPTEVTGLWGEARYATNRLSESTEHVLAVAKGMQVWKFLVSQPKGTSTWEPAEGLAVMKKLAGAAKI